jgi:hypothetical protein
MNRLIVFLLLVTAGTAAYAQAEQPKSNFSGTWVFDAHKSKLTVPAPSAMTLQIKQDNDQFNFDRSQTYGEQSFNWKLDATVGSAQPIEDKAPGYTTASKLYWDNSVLVLEQTITAADGTKVNDLVKYSMMDNGNTLKAIEMQTTTGGKGANSNTWVYERKAQ